MERKTTIPLQARAAAVAADTIDDEARTVEVTWTTGARVRTFAVLDGRFEVIHEELEVSERAIRRDRINAGMPALASHRAHSLDAVLGRVEPESVTIEGGEGRARVRFVEGDDDAERVWNKVRQGVITAVSVGYRVHRFEEVGRAEDGKRIMRAVDWEPHEISFVPIGADAGAHVRAEDGGEYPATIIMNEDDMTERNQPAAEGAPDNAGAAAGADQDLDRVRSEAATAARDAERERAKAINTFADKINAPADVRRRWHDSGMSVEEVIADFNADDALNPAAAAQRAAEAEADPDVSTTGAAAAGGIDTRGLAAKRMRARHGKQEG